MKLYNFTKLSFPVYFSGGLSYEHRLVDRLVDRLGECIMENYDVDFDVLLQYRVVAISFSGGLTPDIQLLLYHLSKYIFENSNTTRILLFENGFLGMITDIFKEVSRVDLDDPDKLQVTTCRNCDPATPEHIEKIKSTLKKNKIDIWVTIGGDGTLKASSQVARALKDTELDISMLYIPATIDGMNMVENSLGLQVSSYSMTELIKMLNNNAWSTNDYQLNAKVSRVSTYVIPGRDRNNCLFSIVDSLRRDNYANNTSSQVLIIPSGKDWKLEDLLNRVSNGPDRQLIVIAEGVSEPIDYKEYSSLPFTVGGIQGIINTFTGTKSNVHTFDKLGQTGIPSEVYSLSSHVSAKLWAEQILFMLSTMKEKEFLALTSTKGGFSPMKISELEYYNNDKNEIYHSLKQEFLDEKIEEYKGSDYIII